MPRSNQTGEFNTFVGGLVTEASPLTFPENASIDEANFVLNKDGSRERRLGLDYEAGLTPYPISYGISPIGDIAVSAFEWGNVSGIAGKTFIVCQVHNTVYLVDRADDSLKSSSWVKDSVDLDVTLSTPPQASFSSIDGKLIIAYGARTVKVVSYDVGLDSFSNTDVVIKIRDLFGVEDKFDLSGDEIDLLSPEYINYRPETSDPEYKHMYNLRNQGWAVPRLDWNLEEKFDLVSSFEYASGLLPSNADSPIPYVYPNPDDPTDKTSNRFDTGGSLREDQTRARAATGHFVIDLLDRGQSREAAVTKVTDTSVGIYAKANSLLTPTYITYRTPTVILPTDRAEGGVRAVAEFAGRVWYGGFSSELDGGDSQSPKLASYIFYSQLVQHEDQIAYCYQEGDPTSVVDPDLLETDGGFIRLSGAYNIQKMVSLGSGLMVFAENGVWFVSGSDSGVFSATNQSVSKVTEHGTLSPSSIVVVDGTVMYWSDDSIYHLEAGQVEGYVVKEISVNIRSLYQAIEDDVKIICQGIYDSYDKKVRWMYNNTYNDLPAIELVLDITLGAFYLAAVKEDLTISKIPMVPIEVSPFNLSTVNLNVLSGTDEVLADTYDVVSSAELVSGGFKATSYLTLIGSEDPSNTSFTFSTYNNLNFKDWGTEDAKAHMLTGYIGTGDYTRYKQVPYIYFHLLRTENGFTDVGDDFTVNNESSCLVQSQWDWANSATSGKWGREFQAYRYKRRYTPDDVTDTYDYGTSTIITKNKLRGRGRVVSLLINSEEEKDMKLLGWSMTIGSNTNA